MVGVQTNLGPSPFAPPFQLWASRLHIHLHLQQNHPKIHEGKNLKMPLNVQQKSFKIEWKEIKGIQTADQALLGHSNAFTCHLQRTRELNNPQDEDPILKVNDQRKEK